MKGQMPPFFGNRPHFWGKPLWAAEHGDGTIKNNYRLYFGGGDQPIVPNNELLNWHAQILFDAGVDFIILNLTDTLEDVPDGPSFFSGNKALFTCWKARRESGLPTPKIAFWITVNDQDPTPLLRLEERYYDNPEYPAEMFFEHLGKKLLLCSPPISITTSYAYPGGVITSGRFANYTTRICHTEASGRIWNFKLWDIDVPPLPFYYGGLPEQVCATVAAGGADGNYNVAPHSRGRENGEYFFKFIQAAIDYGAQFVLIYSWNEWIAGNQVGNPQGPPNTSFIDQFLFEYSSDIEPVKGGFGDAPPNSDYAWYNAMKAKINDFKQAPTPPIVLPAIPGTYHLVAQHSQLRLDVRGGNTQEGGEICQANPNNTDSQIWAVDAHPVFPNTVRLTARVSGKCLDVNNGAHDLGAKVSQSQYNGTMAQAWTLIPHPNIPGYYVLRAFHSGAVLGVRDGYLYDASTPGAPIPLINQYSFNRSGAEAWRFDPI